KTYRSSLLIFHIFCDARAIPEIQCVPTHPDLISLFIAYLTGSYSRKTISNYVFGIHAWHIFHSQTWSLNDLEINALLTAAKHLSPASSCRKKQQPSTVNFISTISRHLILNSPLDAAIYACLTTSFCTISRAGKLSIPTLTSFDATRHIK
ncbi:hypothetical protein PAXRUDRAFT_166882, partial [Paxillus rubicundulus Ve08.2h10]